MESNRVDIFKHDVFIINTFVLNQDVVKYIYVCTYFWAPVTLRQPYQKKRCIIENTKAGSCTCKYKSPFSTCKWGKEKEGIIMLWNITIYVNTVETLYSTIYYSKYFIELNFGKSTQYVALWTHKRHPIPHPFGRAMECLLWVLQQKLTML